MGLFSLIFKIGADSTEFNRGMDQAVDRSKRAARQMSDSFSLRKGLNGAAELLGGYIGAAQVKELIDFGGRMQDMSERTGVAAEKLQEIDYALRLSGSSAERAEKAMRALADAREKALANPKGEQMLKFNALGIGPEELRTLRDSGDLFLRFGDAISKIKLDASSLPAILDLIGTQNAEILPAMAAGLRESAEEARRLGLILSNEAIEDLDALGDQITTTLTAIKKPFAEVILFFARAVDAAIQAVRMAATGAANYMNTFIQLNPLAPKWLKNEAQGFVNALNEEFAQGFNQFLDRNDPEKIARAREAKKKRADRARAFDQEGLLDEIKAGKAPEARERELQRLKSDSLLAVGNFLGSGPDRMAAEARKQTLTLERIQRILEDQGRGGVIRFD